MADLKLSVVVPTRNRPEKLRRTLTALSEQRGFDASSDYEVIVVDDGSVPRVEAVTRSTGPVSEVLRLGGDGPSAARNLGASRARGELLVFVDDDMQVADDFLESHWQAHLEWPDSLQVGSNRLPDAALERPFGRFRQRMEAEPMPALAGPIDTHQFSTAANLAIQREAFERLGGFDPALSTGEDQDLALRHTEQGGRIVFVPNARAVHDDDALSLRGYCERAQRYMEEIVRFGGAHPDLPETVDRAEVNGPIRWRAEPVTRSAKKLIKAALIWPPIRAVAFAAVRLLERIAPDSSALDRLYRTILGAYLQRGYRSALGGAHG
jgi:GT2 family glycosyltransferase